MNKDEVIRKILDAATTGKHSDAVKALDEFGAAKWKEAQADAMKANQNRTDKDILKQRPVASFTPYKP